MKKRQNFRLTLTYAEFFYLIFKRKRCPKCNTKMKKHKTYTIKLQRELKAHDGFSSSGHFMVADPDRETRVYQYHFTCMSCSSQFPLSELADKKREEIFP